MKQWQMNKQMGDIPQIPFNECCWEQRDSESTETFERIFFHIEN